MEGCRIKLSDLVMFSSDDSPYNVFKAKRAASEIEELISQCRYLPEVSIGITGGHLHVTLDFDINVEV